MQNQRAHNIFAGVKSSLAVLFGLNGIEVLHMKFAQCIIFFDTPLTPLRAARVIYNFLPTPSRTPGVLSAVREIGCVPHRRNAYAVVRGIYDLDAGSRGRAGGR